MRGALLFFLEPFYTRSCEDHVRQPKTHSGSCEAHRRPYQASHWLQSSLPRRLDKGHTGIWDIIIIIIIIIIIVVVVIIMFCLPAQSRGREN